MQNKMDRLGRMVKLSGLMARGHTLYFLSGMLIKRQRQREIILRD